MTVPWLIKCFHEVWENTFALVSRAECESAKEVYFDGPVFPALN